MQRCYIYQYVFMWQCYVCRYVFTWHVVYPVITPRSAPCVLCSKFETCLRVVHVALDSGERVVGVRYPEVLVAEVEHMLKEQKEAEHNECLQKVFAFSSPLFKYVQLNICCSKICFFIIYQYQMHGTTYILYTL